MAYKIKPDKALDEGVRRVARDQLEKAIGILYNEPDGRHEAIHAARKRFKKLRGLYRLVRKDASGFYDRENVRLREVAKSLSIERDATALVETLDRLLKTQPNEQNTAALSAIRHHLEARRDRIAEEETDLDDKIATAISSCEDAIEALSDLNLPGKPKKASKVVARGFAKTYARAVEAFAQARETRSAEDWHELRKRIKYHWMHIRLLRTLWPGEMKLRARTAKQAADDLGDDHDLAVLSALAESEPDTLGDASEIALLHEAMDVESQRLRTRIESACKVLLADDPKVVRSRVEALYRDAG